MKKIIGSLALAISCVFSGTVTAAESQLLHWVKNKSSEVQRKLRGNTSDDKIVQRGTVGAGEGDDTYILAASLIDENADITITDTQGSNRIHLIGGLQIESSIVASSTLQLTLSNGAKVTVLDSDTFSFDIGGDPLQGTTGTSHSFSNFAKDILKISSGIPMSGVENGSGVEVNDTGLSVLYSSNDNSSQNSSLDWSNFNDFTTEWDQAINEEDVTYNIRVFCPYYNNYSGYLSEIWDLYRIESNSKWDLTLSTVNDYGEELYSANGDYLIFRKLGSPWGGGGQLYELRLCSV